MSTILPVGLTYLLPISGNLTLSASDIVSSSGQIGPLTLKLTNTSNSAVAVVSYDNELVPQPPVTYTNVPCSSNYGAPVVDITVDPANNIPVVDTIVNSNGFQYYTGVTVQCGGSSIGGAVGFVSFSVTGTSNGDGPGMITSMVYSSGYVPAGGGANLPTEGNPTKVFTIPPLVSELVQIPASNNGSTTLVASGADVYVTPIQIVA